MIHNEGLCSSNRSSNIIRDIKSRRLRLTGHVARMEERNIALKSLKGKPKGKRLLRKPRPRWDDNIRMYIRK